MQDKLAAVFGGSGFLGRYVVRALAGRGWRVRAASRRPYLAGHLQPMGDVGQIHAVQANVRHAYSVSAPLAGAEAVVNLAGISTKSGAQTLADVNVDGARAVARAARKAGVKTLIHVSTICAHSKSASHVGRTKAKGEAAVLEEFPDAVIFRPTLMFGAEDRLFNRVAAFARLSPLIPLIGGGWTKVQLVYVGDVAEAIAAACAGLAKPGTTYELGGPDIISYRELVDHVLEWSGRRRWYVPVPYWLAKVAVAATAPMPDGMRPLTVDQMAMFRRPSVVSRNATLEKRTFSSLGIERLHTMGSVVPQYLERFHPRGQFASYRG
jgi:NADH dehydrogenase